MIVTLIAAFIGWSRSKQYAELVKKDYRVITYDNSEDIKHKPITLEPIDHPSVEIRPALDPSEKTIILNGVTMEGAIKELKILIDHGVTKNGIWKWHD